MDINYSDFFIAIYTNSCKKYCDEAFFPNLLKSKIGNAIIEIVDNSKTDEYSYRICALSGKKVVHISVDREPKETLFLRNVFESLKLLRNLFLTTSCKYFITLESDVLPPKDWLNYFMEVIDKVDIIGGIYYSGFHAKDMFENDDIFQTTHHVLSGCTLYKRKVIEDIPFRYDETNKNAFPDALISYDACRNGNKFTMANYSKILCRHLTKEGSDSRGLEDLE